MKSIRVLSLSLALAFSAIMGSCSSESGNRPKTADHLNELDSLVQILRRAEKDISQGFLLKNASLRSKESVVDAIYELKIASYRLVNELRDEGGLVQLFLAFQAYDKIALLKDDESFLGDLKQATLLALDAVSAYQGKSLDGIDRPLFEKQFQSSLQPFKVVTTVGNPQSGWIQASTRDIQYAKVGDLGRGSGGAIETWLLSPRLDLSATKNPALSIEQAINVSRNSSEKFADVVSVLVSTDLVTSDPNAVTWKALKFKTLPKGTDFNFLSTEKIDLKEYEGQSIIVALKFAAKANSLVVWEVSKLVVWGTGKLSEDQLNLTVPVGGSTAPPTPSPSPAPVSGDAAAFDFTFGEALTGTVFAKAGDSETQLKFLFDRYTNIKIPSSPTKGIRFSSFDVKNKSNGTGKVWVESVDLPVPSLAKLNVIVTESLWLADAASIQDDRAKILWAPAPEAGLAVADSAWTLLSSGNRSWNKGLSVNFGTTVTATNFSDIQLPENVSKMRLRFQYDAKGDLSDPFWLIQRIQLVQAK